jgi:N,N'-diacetyllegionaminate synthase
MIIAEAGVNHNGSLDMARELVRAAYAAGADVVKFQAFNTDLCIAIGAQKAEYQIAQTGEDESQYDMVKKLELNREDFLELQQECHRSGIIFNASPFDLASIDFLHSLHVPFWKIPSGEIVNLPYLRKIAGYGEPVVMSTGMATMDEVHASYRVLCEHGVDPGQITLLHCHTDYPTRFEDVNLTAMNTLQRAFPESRVGYSDHTIGIEACVAATALGATIIEKHFTLDCSLPGPDHKASLEPDELAAMVRAVRNIELALGDGVKRPTESEVQIRSVARKSIVAACSIRVGDLFCEENLTVKRPGGGVNPMRWDDYIGKTAGRDYNKDEQIDA